MAYHRAPLPKLPFPTGEMIYVAWRSFLILGEPAGWQPLFFVMPPGLSRALFPNVRPVPCSWKVFNTLGWWGFRLVVGSHLETAVARCWMDVRQYVLVGKILLYMAESHNNITKTTAQAIINISIENTARLKTVIKLLVPGHNIDFSTLIVKMNVLHKFSWQPLLTVTSYRWHNEPHQVLWRQCRWYEDSILGNLKPDLARSLSWDDLTK